MFSSMDKLKKKVDSKDYLATCSEPITKYLPNGWANSYKHLSILGLEIKLADQASFGHCKNDSTLQQSQKEGNGAGHSVMEGRWQLPSKEDGFQFCPCY